MKSKIQTSERRSMENKPLSITAKLASIQASMEVPKNLHNDYGNYYYRNAESILKAVKPYLTSLGLYLTLNDSIEQVGDRYYVKATAILTDIESDQSVEVSAYARESEKRSGMDDSQLTGSTSSYARKYALNGLFLLDDTKDADTNEYHDQQKTEEQKIKEMTAELKELYSKTTGKNFDKWVKDCGGVSMNNYMSMKATLMKQINDAADKEKKE